MDVDAFYDDVVTRTAEYLNPGLARLLSFAGFGVEVKAEGCILTDHEGKEYLDCLGGYGCFALGHRHPKVIEAVKKQLDLMPLGSKAFFSKPQVDLAERLAKIAPKGLKYTFFCNSGAEAVEAALKLAKGATKRSRFVSTIGGYHGKTLGSLAVTGREKYQKPFRPLMEHVDFVEFGNIDQAVGAITTDTAAIIIEAIQGEGGIQVPPPGYLSALREATTANGALLIIDEVQTGIGRTGRWFGCDKEGVSPDLMPLAKLLGGGVMPIGACMGTEAVWDAVFGENPLLHTSTFGGNPLACAAGIAALDAIEEEGLIERCRIQGEKLKAGLTEVKRKHSDLILDVRGEGLMLGVELSIDEVGELIVAQLLQRGMIVAYTLNNPRVLRFEPPYTISDTQIEYACSMLDESVQVAKELVAEYV